jgi:hypothetical protein
MPSETSTLDPTRPPVAARRRRRGVRLVLATAALAVLAACSPTQMREWYDSQGIDHSQMSEQQVADAAAVATWWWGEVFKENAELARWDWVLTPEQLYRLRMCESTDNYQAVSSTGLYRGAYQFHQGTWDSVARQHLPRYVGIDPAMAQPKVQDAMTRALWSMTGPRSWPVCGYRV